MGERTLPAAGQQFIDRNNKLVQFIAIAVYESMNTEMAVYQALSGSYKVYTMPWIDFIKEMRPFVPYEAMEPAEKVKSEEIAGREEAVRIEPGVQTAGTAKVSYERREEAGGVNPVLMEFLDAKNYEEKLNVLTGSRKYLNESILNHMAISVDCNIGEGDIEDRINNLIYCLKTHARFENRRLR